MLDLKNPSHAYLFGFVQADGHLRRIKGNKGALSVELSSQDRWLLERFAQLVPVYSSITTRQRKTNFKDEYESAVWTVYDFAFRQTLLALGMPEGRKSSIVAPPRLEFSKPDYYRGLIDADGALGLTANGFPFLTLTTRSEVMANGYLDFVEKIIGKAKTSSRNLRDQVFNIAVFKEDAQKLVATMYYKGCLALPRKKEKAKQIVRWVRPMEMKKIENRKQWTPEEDGFVMNHSIKESALALERSEKSVNLRRWRLRNGIRG
ncbi:MAG: LAGLIDADG family homing endonuclease [Acidobacteriota bacterium]|nr:LAGLIDADG family homing endonuclease [Acidobacteriota bacterium]